MQKPTDNKLKHDIYYNCIDKS